MSIERPDTIQYPEIVMSEDTAAVDPNQSVSSDADLDPEHSDPSVSSDPVNQETVHQTEAAESTTSEDQVLSSNEAASNTELETESKPDSEAVIRLATEVESLRLQVEERTGQCVRIAADFDNFRKRTEREKSELELRVKRDAISELLPVIDSFERARTQIKPQTEEEVNIHKSYQGVYKQLVDGLKRIGVSPMRVEGQPFDPNFHDAIMREPTSEHPEGTVTEELRRGYLLGDLVLRHALVKVAAPPENSEEASGEQRLDPSPEEF